MLHRIPDISHNENSCSLREISFYPLCEISGSFMQISEYFYPFSTFCYLRRSFTASTRHIEWLNVLPVHWFNSRLISHARVDKFSVDDQSKRIWNVCSGESSTFQNFLSCLNLLLSRSNFLPQKHTEISQNWWMWRMWNLFRFTEIEKWKTIFWYFRTFVSMIFFLLIWWFVTFCVWWRRFCPRRHKVDHWRRKINNGSVVFFEFHLIDVGYQILILCQQI